MKSWLFRFFRTRPAKSKNPLAGYARPRLETLEERVVPTVNYNGGAVLPALQAQALYLGSAWSGLPQQQSAFNGFLGATTAGSYLPMLGNAGYTDSAGHKVGAGSALPSAPVDGTSPVRVTDLRNYAGTVLTDAQIQTYLQRDITSGLVADPASNPSNLVYFLFVEPNVIVDQRTSSLSISDGANSTKAFLGYHSSFAGKDAKGNAAQVRYVVLPYQGSNGFLNNGSHVANAQETFLSFQDSMTLVASHEMAEGATDPDLNKGWVDNQDKGRPEIGDLAVASTVYLNGYAVQRESSRSGSLIDFAPLTPRGATAGHQAAFSLTSTGDLYVINGSTPAAGTRIASGVASISDQGIDDWGQPMIDIVLANGNAEEYHDFLPLNGTTNPLVAGSPNYFPFTPLGPNVAQARAGQGVSYILLTNGQLGEYVDPNYATRYGYSSNPTPPGTSLGVIATGVTAIDVGTDAFGGNSVDYTTVANGVTILHQWRDAGASLFTLASGVTSFSAGQYGIHGYVDASGNASVFSESTGQTTSLAAGVQSVAVGVDASGGYLVQLLYTNGTAESYDGLTKTFAPVNGGATGVRVVGKTFNGMYRILLANGQAFESSGPPWLTYGTTAIA